MEELIQNIFATIFGVRMSMPITFFNLGIAFWNRFVFEGLNYLQNTPQNFMNGEPYSFISAMNTIIVSVAVPLSLLFFMWGFFNESINIKEEMDIINIIKMIVRLLVANYFIVHCMNLLNAFISIFTGLNSKILTRSDTTGLNFPSYVTSGSNEDVDYEISDLFDGKLFITVFSIVVCVILVVCGVMVLYNIFTTYLNLLILMCFGSIAFSSMSAGNHEFHNMSMNYIKNFIATAAQMVVIVVSLNLVGVVCRNSFKEGGLINIFATLLDSGNKLNGYNHFIATGILYCLMASLCIGMIKGATNITQKIFT